MTPMKVKAFKKTSRLAIATALLAMAASGCRSKSTVTDINTDSTAQSTEEIRINRLSDQIMTRLLTIGIDSPRIEILHYPNNSPDNRPEIISVSGKRLKISYAARDSATTVRAASVSRNDSVSTVSELHQNQQVKPNGCQGLRLWLIAGGIVAVMLCCRALYRRNRPR